MTLPVDELAAQARALPVEERARLVESLLDSLLEGGSQTDEAAANPDSDAEIARRVADVRAGTVASLPADEVHADLRRLIGR